MADTDGSLGATALDDVFVSERSSEIRDVVQALTVPHHVEASRGAVDGLVRARRLVGTNVVFVRYGSAVVVEAAPAGETVGLTFPLGPMGVGRSRVDDQGSREGGFVLDPDHRTLMVPDPMAGALVVAVDRSRVRAHLCAMVGRDIGGDLELVAGHRWTPAVDSTYVDAVVRGTWAAATAKGVLPATAARMLEQNLLNAILLGLPHSHSHLLAAEPVSPSAARAVQARAWLEDHYEQAVGVVDLADAVGLSVRQVQAVFAREHHTSPMEMLRDIRLDRAHQRLSEGSIRAVSVTYVALSCGFGHLGRFAGFYRARFGESPSLTLRRGDGLSR